VISKKQVTENIYTSWLKTVDCNAFPSQRIKKLNSFTVEELNHLKWLIDQELQVRVMYKADNSSCGEL